MSLAAIQRFYPEVRYGGFTAIDGTIAFYTRVQALAEDARCIVDVGCGPGAFWQDALRLRKSLRDLRSARREVIGLDVDEKASANPSLDKFVAIRKGERWPIDDGIADLALVDFVLEHIETPHDFLVEVSRLLRPGGVVCIRTSNLLHYVGLCARLIPQGLQNRALKVAQPLRHEGDAYPTFHRCNTLWAVRRTLRGLGFEAVVYGYEAEPGYLHFSQAAFAAGVLYQKLAPEFMRANIFAFGRKAT